MQWEPSSKHLIWIHSAIFGPFLRVSHPFPEARTPMSFLPVRSCAWKRPLLLFFTFRSGFLRGSSSPPRRPSSSSYLLLAMATLARLFPWLELSRMCFVSLPALLIPPSAWRLFQLHVHREVFLSRWPDERPHHVSRHIVLVSHGHLHQ